MFQHAVNNPQDFVHADAYSGHIVFSLFPVFFIYLPDQGVTLNGRQGDHIQNLARRRTALFTHFEAADTISADFINGVYPKKGSQFFCTGETLDGLNFDDQSDSGQITDTGKSL